MRERKETYLEMQESDALQGLAHFVEQLSQVSRRGMRAALAGAPRCRFGALERLHYSIQRYGENGEIYVTDLARALNKPLPASSRGLRQLEQDGMVERRTDPRDRRKTLVRITPAGEQARRECEAALNAFFTRVMGRIEPARLAQMMQLRQSLIDALEAETAATVAAAKGEAPNGEDL